MPISRFDLVVVGAGPAGLAAAAVAADAGCSVALLDSAGRPGGQYWRHPPGRLAAVADLHHALPTFTSLVAAAATRVTYLPRHHVWTVTRTSDGYDVLALRDEIEVVVSGAALVLAPGAYDRQLPFPGWDLPGVFTAGGAQALLKGHEVMVGRRVAVGGTGPFLLSLAAGLADSRGRCGRAVRGEPARALASGGPGRCRTAEQGVRGCRLPRIVGTAPHPTPRAARHRRGCTVTTGCAR